MDTLQDAYKDDEENHENPPLRNENGDAIDEINGVNVVAGDQIASASEVITTNTVITDTATATVESFSAIEADGAESVTKDATIAAVAMDVEIEAKEVKKEEGFEGTSSDSISDEKLENVPKSMDTAMHTDEEDPPLKKQKSLSLLTPEPAAEPSSAEPSQLVPKSGVAGSKKVKKKSKNNNVWTKSTSRKGKKKSKSINNSASKIEDKVLVAPILRFPDKNDDSPEMKICLSKIYKAEKVELSEDRMSAGSCKGYRMVRATRGVTEGSWYFEIKVVHLGETGHTRLGWSTEKGDLQAPVGYDANSFGYRDIDGSKINKALREKYGEEGYKEGDVIGFYINLPEGNLYAPKPPQWVWYKGQRYVCTLDPKEDPPKIVPGSEISFFKNGVCQGVAFKDLYGGCYYPAASMYTLPDQPNCQVKFNFGPDFECYPQDLEGRPIPRPMIEVPYQGFENRVENGTSNERTL